MGLAWIGALAIGLTLGLTGSGGSILTVPILTYIVGQDEKVAIAGSLAIVGGISLFAALPYVRHRLIDYRSVVWFGVPGMAGSYGGAWISRFVPGGIQLFVFALIMLVAAVFMLRPPALRETRKAASRAVWRIVVDGLLVGVVTGFVGVGGGFLIVPALVVLGAVPMHTAIGTSLLIIALKSGTAFIKYIDVLSDLGLGLDWMVIGSFIPIGIGGSLVGSRVATRLPQRTLRRLFGSFLVLMGIYIVWRSAPALLGS